MAGIDDPGWIATGTVTVRPEWIDYNGHMNVGYYLVAFDQSTEAVCVKLGVGESYRRDHDASIFVLEAHVTYDREVTEGSPLAFRSWIVDHDPKRFHLLHRMFHAEAGFLAATNELMCMHVDLKTRRSAPLPQSAQGLLVDLHGGQTRVEDGEYVGRRIGIRRS